MNLVQTRKDILAGISPAINDELEQLLARIQVVWSKEHDPQTGQHTTIRPSGLEWRGSVALTVGAAGGGAALPATPSGYLVFTYGTKNYQIPFYSVA